MGISPQIEGYFDCCFFYSQAAESSDWRSVTQSVAVVMIVVTIAAAMKQGQ